MTVSAAPGSTTESRAAALAMFEGNVPCFFSFGEPPCLAVARHLAFHVHEENTMPCGHDEPWPVCDEHKQALQAVSNPFWRTWHQMQPMLCSKCKTPLRLDRFEPLGS